MRDGFKHGANDAVVGLLNVERRLDPYFRDGFDRLFQRPIAALAQFLINVGRRGEALGLAEEQPLPDEEALAREIVETMGAFLRRT